MTVRIIVMPTGPKATREAIETWKASGQKVANEYHAEIELKSRNTDGSVAAHLIATPDEGEISSFSVTSGAAGL